METTKVNVESTVNKRIKKLVEAIIIENKKELIEKFGELEYNDALKHKTKISNLAIEDDELENVIKHEIEDCIGAYLLSKPAKKYIAK